MTFPEGHAPWREQLGAYALGVLDPAEHRDVRAHLLDCDACLSELASLEGLPSVLQLADPEQIGAPIAPPADLGDRVVRAVRRERRRTTTTAWTRMLAPATAVIAVVAVLTVLQPREDEPPLEQVAVQVESGAVEATASLIAHTWGTEIILVAEGLDDGAEYRVDFETDGKTVHAGSFIGVGDKTMTCRLNAALLRGDATGFTVEDADGTTVLRGRLAPPTQDV